MRKIIVFAIAICISANISAQEVFEFKFFPSIHFGIFTGADDINTFIENDLSNYSIISGTSDIILSFNLGVGGTFRFFKLVEIQPLVEYSFAPKLISGADKSYSFNKFTGGMMANLLIPLGATKNNSWIVGVGLMYNNMSFEDFSGSAVNPRIQTGLSLSNNKFNPQIILAYDFANANDDEFEGFELDYKSVRFGVNLNF